MKSAMAAAIVIACASAAPALAQDDPSIAIRPFVFGSVQSFTAIDTFDAVFGRAYDPFYGGGVQAVFDGKFFVELSASRFRQTGQRAFISGGQKFRLGIPLTWAVSVVGLVDFANAFVQARSAGVVSDLGAAYFIPIVIVPAAVVSHVMILGLLLRRSGNRRAK